ncbi:hypothetical protein DM860_002533 [Cuscuta australis]|uniref:Uncharacterized protein n=1 Tax=Cuscuta australis TaxID=267555 RepID=A0A328CYM3_9ASTE|nr:hypothetical protein DM860_002533 [Cuscuta australis]
MGERNDDQVKQRGVGELGRLGGGRGEGCGSRKGSMALWGLEGVGLAIGRRGRGCWVGGSSCSHKGRGSCWNKRKMVVVVVGSGSWVREEMVVVGSWWWWWWLVVANMAVEMAAAAVEMGCHMGCHKLHTLSIQFGTLIQSMLCHFLPPPLIPSSSSSSPSRKRDSQSPFLDLSVFHKNLQENMQRRKKKNKEEIKEELGSYMIINPREGESGVGITESDWKFS